MGASAIIAGVGVAASVAGTVGSMASSSGGGGGGGNMDATMAMLARNQASGRDAINDYYNKASSYLAPWRDAGGAAVNQWSGLMGLPGYTALDPTETLEGTPGYKFLRDQGTEALRRYGAGTGMLSSGAGMKGATDYGQKLAQTYAWQPYMSSLQSLSGQGLSAASTTGGYAMQAGGQLGNLYSGMGNTQAQVGMQQGIMDAQSSNASSNDLMSGLGYGIQSLNNSGISNGIADWLSMFSATGNTSGALNSMPGMSLGQLYSGWGGGGSNQAFNASSGGGWVPAGATYYADGGHINAGQPGIVGERGPELFIPSVPGYIIPNEYTRYSAFGRRN